jgi:glycerol kinase
MATGKTVEYELRRNWREERTWCAAWDEDRRARGYKCWQKAVRRTMN